MAAKAFAAVVVLLVLAAGELAAAASSRPPVSTLPQPSSAPAQATAAVAMEEASALATTRRHTRIAGEEGRSWGGEAEDGKSISVHSLPPERVLPTLIPPTSK
ncbi:hypothetical protein BRADI_1g02470v3 [Brachypodium distachyon]|uniref:Uncharacterized protein n=1 Tax=Brachypodium distachyon TaxID=15368 RepID=I1GL47_BRADI|nr:hypothetical protein BRADI_1g02470v3 [Brachypodium distachyon]